MTADDPILEGPVNLALADNDAKIATLRENLAYYREHAADCFARGLMHVGGEAKHEADRLDELLALRSEIARMRKQ